MTGDQPARPPGVDRGDGPTIAIISGFGLRPPTYEPAAVALDDRFRIVVPDVFGRRRSWDDEALAAEMWGDLDAVGVDRCILVGHSFGGGLALDLAARAPARVEHLVFVDSVALAERWRLAASALTGASLFRLATPRAAIDWLRTALGHPLWLVRAARWAWSTGKAAEIETVRRAGVPTTVLWAERDTLVKREHGMHFASRIGADFHVVTDPAGQGPVDHDWIFRHPDLFAGVVDRLHAGGSELVGAAATVAP